MAGKSLFQLESAFELAGDQPQAMTQLVQGLEQGRAG